MHFDSVTGWVRGVRHCPSPNFNLRPQGDAVSLLVIHNISLPPGQFGTGKVQVRESEINQEGKARKLWDIEEGKGI